MSLSNIDKLEKFSQVFYCGSLLLAPAWWLSDNFVDQSVASARELHVCNVVGVLVGCILAITGWARMSAKIGSKDMANLDYLGAGAWGACGLLTLRGVSLYKADKFFVNVGLQLGLAGAYYYQGKKRAEKKD